MIIDDNEHKPDCLLI